MSGPSIVEEGGAIGCMHMLRHTSEPRNAIITLVAKDNAAQATLREPIYGTRTAPPPLRLVHPTLTFRPPDPPLSRQLYPSLSP